MLLQTIIIVTLIAICLPFIVKFIKHKSLYPLMPFKYNFKRRRVTFAKTIQLLDERNAKIIVETGTSRLGLKATKGDGAATIVFGKWALQNDAKLHSVDISEESVNGSRSELEIQGLQDVVTVYKNDSIDFLNNFKENIDFLYLDSYDYCRIDTEIQRKSQEHHLKEFKAIEDRLHEDTIVLIDDCGLPGGGKGKTLVEYMLKKDWQIVINAYQILLIKKENLESKAA